jgi:phosphoserine aminotransferase
MTSYPKPSVRPRNPNFSSGPCAKRPGWSSSVLDGALLGRSHRSKEGLARLKLAIARTKALLELPGDYLCAIVPGSDTGAFEAALWNLLGARGVDVLAWETFGKAWVRDVVRELRLEDVRVLEAEYGCLPDLAAVDFERDVVFTWNGTTSGVRVPDGDWIAEDRRGLTICDATSAAFGQRIDWPKIDVATFSWQKCLGGEAGHGMLIMSPRAVERLAAHVPRWPVPKLFRLKDGGRVMLEIFEGHTINTPSLLAVEDYLDTLDWAERVGGLAALQARADANAALVFDWIDATPWGRNLAMERSTWSNTSVCISPSDAIASELGASRSANLMKGIAQLLDAEGVAHDISSHRDAPGGLRIWTGATIEKDNVAALLPWLDWAYREQRAAVLANS